MNDATTLHKLFLDDLSIGDTFRSGTYLIDEQQIKSFAWQFDPQPFHLDNQEAEQTFFAGLAASGWHTAAITMRLLVSCLPLDGGLIGAGGEVSWPTATRPGDELRVETSVLAINPSKSKPDRGLVTFQTDTLNQHGELRQRTVAKLLVFRRSSLVTH
jgi:acyl dehydratase